ncbi:putative amino acid ABC transporter, substrate binding protein [Tersicoccus solisilvae]|uniref:Amino acid ABC transporter, substrate binding protein n=1 Tax=Tersicoccus solisilvae TaxID=1882339 RepID=A0ABQ1P5D5_9MICC|nr:ABC transporter substrate-binding protein [Tersicoccus solisilvae]GGC91107.1 putative amino acid ABC transporter, substrate binding protein [Tersicoccus solisilvae]
MKALFTRGRAARAAAVAGALSLTLSVAACGAGSGSNPLQNGGSSASAAPADTVVVGSANFPESQVIAEIYAGAINASGGKASTKPNIGSREVYIKALTEGSIDVVPDYSGNLLQYFDKSSTAVSASDITAALPGKLPGGLKVLESSKAEDKDAMVVTKPTAEKYSLKSIEDMAKVCDQLTVAGPPEFAERAYGVPGLKSKYDCTPKSFEPFNGGAVILKALLDDRVQVADIFTTDPAIKDNDLVVLDDPKNNFIAQQVLPVIKDGKLSSQASEALNKVSAQLTTDDLINLNRTVSGESKTSPKDAAAQWLKQKGIAQ